MPFAKLSTGVRMFYTDEGAGDPPLLLVHGYTADSHDWSWQIPHFVASHRVVAVDLRGHGRSSAPDTGYNTPQFAADLVDLLDQLEIASVVAMGHSMGGGVVSALAVEYPERVRAVVAVDPAYLIPDEIAQGIRPLLDMLDEMADFIPLIQQLVGGLDSEAIEPALRTWHTRRVASVEPHVLRQALEAQALGIAMHSQSDPYLRRRSCPVLSFYADPSREAAEVAVFADEQSRVVTWEGAGHWVQQERPTEFNTLVSSWLTSLG